MKNYYTIKNEEAWRRYGQSYNDCLEWVDRKELSEMDEQIAKDFAKEVAMESLRSARDSFDIGDIEVTEGGIVCSGRIEGLIYHERNIPTI